MNFLVLMGSPRTEGNTAELCKPFTARLKELGNSVRYVELTGLDINPCLGCYACQDVSGEYGCVQRDDMYPIVSDIIKSNCVVFASPIYSWYCPTAMKSLLDRHYGLNKFYGTAAGSLWAGKCTAIITTHGYTREYGAEPFETGIMRLSEHSGLHYLGMYSVRDTDGLASFKTPEAVAGARDFADLLTDKMNNLYAARE